MVDESMQGAIVVGGPSEAIARAREVKSPRWFRWT